MNTGQRHQLSEWFGDRVRFDESLSAHTTLRIGGPARAFVCPESEAEVGKVIRFCRQNGLDFRVIGGGSNILAPDNGVSGVVIAMAPYFNKIDLYPGKLSAAAMAGAGLSALCRKTRKAGLGGLDFAVGIPGTVGGAVMMNAGTRIGAMADVVEAVFVVDGKGKTNKIERSALRFSYRRLALPSHVLDKTDAHPVISRVHFTLHPSDPVSEADKKHRAGEKRMKTQPLGTATAGCFFKNPENGPGAGELIDRAGLKGKIIDGAQVSEKHANFIVNLGTATEENVLFLARLVQREVRDRFGVKLIPEVIIWGDGDHGLS